MVYNEEQKLDRLLAVLVRSRPAGADITRIVVVSSGSTDRSTEIAEAWQARGARIAVITEPVRRGKAKAINLFMASADAEVWVLISGDVLPENNAVDLILRPFADPSVGMTGAHPRPTNPRRGLANRIVHFQWHLHHLVA